MTPLLQTLPTLQAGFDRVLRPALFGVQCRDVASRRVISDGLRLDMVDLWQPPQRHQRRTLQANRSGVFVLQGFAGFTGFSELRDGAVTSPPEPGRYQLQLSDPLRRYVPMSVAVGLPHAGLFGIPDAEVSPSDTAPHIPLFSAATRSAPPDQCTLRAELRQASQPTEPAAWARLELWLGSERVAQGLADDAGRALLVFPQPRPPDPVLRVSPAVPLAPQPWQWDLTLRAFWQPLPDDAMPELQTLFNQPEQALLQDLSPSTPLAPLTLRANRPLLASGTRSAPIYIAA